MELADQKRALRAEVRAARAALDPAARSSQSARIAEHVLAMPEVCNARCIHVFLSMPTEVDTFPIARALLRRGVRVVCPVVRPGAPMSAVEITESDLARVELVGPLRVPQPTSGSATVPGVWDVVLVPLVAATLAGARLGNGAGHYDRLLTEREHPAAGHAAGFAVGLALDVQVVPEVPTEPHDVGLDALATTAGVVRSR